LALLNKRGGEKLGEKATPLLVIEVDGAKLEITHLTWVKALKMKAEVEGVSLEELIGHIVRETRELYAKKLYPTKFGEVKAYQNEKGDWVVDEFWEGEIPYSLQNVLERNVYLHIRAYLMGLVLSEMAQEEHAKGKKLDWEPETIVMRADNTVAIVKKGQVSVIPFKEWLRSQKKQNKP
jgi:hypothetical protein